MGPVPPTRTATLTLQAAADVGSTGFGNRESGWKEPKASDIKAAMEAERQEAALRAQRQAEAEKLAAEQRARRLKAKQGGSRSPQDIAEERVVQQPKFELNSYDNELPTNNSLSGLSPQNVVKRGVNRNVVTQSLGIVSATNFTTSTQASQTQIRDQEKRVKEIKKMLGRRVAAVETAVVFSQRPQKDLELFLSGKSKYYNSVSKSLQTGNERLEEASQTELPDVLNQEIQAPTLTTGRVSNSSGTRMLPFLRRVLGIMETNLQHSKVSRNLRKKAEKAGKKTTGAADVSVANSFGLDFGAAEAICGANYLGRPHLLVLYGMSQEACRYFMFVVL